jgi:hypothetical protein
MTLGADYTGMSVRIAAVVVPVAMYFFILGFLNTRRTPQLLTARLDFSLLLAALGPLFVLPLIQWARPSAPTTALAMAACVAGAVVWLGWQRRGWVIYNLDADVARDLLADALGETCDDVRAAEDGFVVRLDETRGSVRLDPFPLLRNVSITLAGGSDALAASLEKALHDRLGLRRAEPAPMAVVMLMIAAAMAVAPLALVAHEGVPVLVRLLNDLLQ